MSKPRGHIQKAAHNLTEKLSLEHITAHTSIFHVRQIGDDDLDQRTVDTIKKQFTMYFNSWVAEDLQTVLTSILKK
jgi:hypothetical protein